MMETCNVPCRPVDEKLDALWSGINKRVPWVVFTLVLAGLGTVLIFFGKTIIDAQTRMAEQIAVISSGNQRNAQNIEHVREAVNDIRIELRRQNGWH